MGPRANRGIVPPRGLFTHCTARPRRNLSSAWIGSKAASRSGAGPARLEVRRSRAGASESRWATRNTPLAQQQQQQDREPQDGLSSRGRHHGSQFSKSVLRKSARWRKCHDNTKGSASLFSRTERACPRTENKREQIFVVG